MLTGADWNHEKIESFLTAKAKTRSFHAHDKLDDFFVSALHEWIASVATSGKTDDPIAFLKSCQSIMKALEIICHHNAALQGYPALFLGRFPLRLNNLIHEVVACFSDESVSEDSQHLFSSYLALLREFLVMPKGVEIVFGLLFAEPLHLLTRNFTSNDAADILPCDMSVLAFETFSALFARWQELMLDNRQKIVSKIPSQAKNDILNLLSAVYRIGDMPSQSAAVLGCCLLCDQNDMIKIVLSLLKERAHVRDSKVPDKVMDSLKEIFHGEDLDHQLRCIFRFLRMANNALGIEKIMSFTCRFVGVNGIQLHAVAPESDIFADVNIASRRLTCIGSFHSSGTPLHVLCINSSSVKGIKSFRDSTPPFSCVISISLSAISRDLQTALSSQGVTDHYFELVLKMEESVALSFLQSLEQIFPPEAFPNSQLSAGSHSSVRSTKTDKYAIAFITCGSSQPKVSRTQNKVYGRQGVALPSANNVARRTLENSASHSVAAPTKLKSSRQDDVSVATVQSLNHVFSANPVNASSKKSVTGESSDATEQESALPEISSSVFSANDYLKKVESQNLLKGVKRDKLKQVCSQPDKPSTVPAEGNNGLTSSKQEGRGNPAPTKKLADKSHTVQTSAHSKGQACLSSIPEVANLSDSRTSAVTPKATTIATRQQPKRQAVIEAERRKQRSNESLWIDEESRDAAPTKRSKAANQKKTPMKKPEKSLSDRNDLIVMPADSRKKRIAAEKRSDNISANQKAQGSTNTVSALVQEKHGKTKPIPESDSTRNAKRSRKPLRVYEFDEADNGLMTSEVLPSLVVEEGELDHSGRLVKRLAVADDNIGFAVSSQSKTRNDSTMKLPLPKERMVRSTSVESSTSVELARASGSIGGVGCNITPTDDAGHESAKRRSPVLLQERSPTTQSILNYGLKANSVNNVTPEIVAVSKDLAEQLSSVPRNSHDNGNALSPSSWSESYSGNCGNTNATSVDKIQPSNKDQDVLSAVHLLVDETFSMVSSLSEQGGRLVDQITRVSGTIRSCCENMQTLGQTATTYATNITQLKQFQKSLALVKLLLKEKHSETEKRRNVESAVLRVFNETGNKQLCNNSEQISVLVDALMKSTGQ